MVCLCVCEGSGGLSGVRVCVYMFVALFVCAFGVSLVTEKRCVWGDDSIVVFACVCLFGKGRGGSVCVCLCACVCVFVSLLSYFPNFYCIPCRLKVSHKDVSWCRTA